MADPIVFGAAYSAYTRIVRLALIEKGVSYRLEPIDIFAPGGPSEGYRARHPFARIPAFEHDGFRLFETSAIVRYVDAALPGPPLRPFDPRAAARCDQIVAILDNYGYRALVWDLFVECVRKPSRGELPDAERIAVGRDLAARTLTAIADLAGPAPWLVDGRLSIADLHMAPTLAYATTSMEGRHLVAAVPRIAAWWEAMAARPAMTATRSPYE